MYQLLNETDYILVAPEIFKTEEEAAAYAAKLRECFVAQGFYLSTI